MDPKERTLHILVGCPFCLGDTVGYPPNCDHTLCPGCDKAYSYRILELWNSCNECGASFEAFG